MLELVQSMSQPALLLGFSNMGEWGHRPDHCSLHELWSWTQFPYLNQCSVFMDQPINLITAVSPCLIESGIIFLLL